MLPEHLAVLVAEDNADDRFFIGEAHRRAQIRNPLVLLNDGEELVSYLSRSGKYDARENPDPALIILDIKMPRKNGLEALDWIRASARWRLVPVIMLTASFSPDDILRAYQSGANAFLVKPSSIQDLFSMFESIRDFWLRRCEAPPES